MPYGVVNGVHAPYVRVHPLPLREKVSESAATLSLVPNSAKSSKASEG
jgi:hypothetical protein